MQQGGLSGLLKLLLLCAGLLKRTVAFAPTCRVRGRTASLMSMGSSTPGARGFVLGKVALRSEAGGVDELKRWLKAYPYPAVS